MLCGRVAAPVCVALSIFPSHRGEASGVYPVTQR